MEAVLHGARHMVAMQIASDPTVRQVLRRAFRERAILSVRPTKKGKKVRAHEHIFIHFCCVGGVHIFVKLMPIVLVSF